MKTEHWRKFLESLEGEKGLPQDYRLLTPGVDTYKYGDEWLHGDFTWCAVSSASIGKLVDKNFNPIVRRAESRQIPDLKEKVKAFVLDAMNVEDDLAPTCMAHYAKDRSTRLVADRRSPLGARPYTVREYARLQGFPDDYWFSGTENQQFKQIGNAVAVPVGEWIGREILRYFKQRR